MSGGASMSQSDAENRSFIDPAQLGYLTELWGQGSTLMNQQGPAAYQQASQNLVNQFMPLGMAGGNAFGAGSQGQLGGQQALAQNMSAQSPWLDQQISNFGTDIQRNLAQNILPELRSGGIAAGAGPTFGRGQIAQGMAADAAQREFAQGATQMRHADIMRQQQAAQALTQSQLAAGQGALSGMGQLYNLGFMPMQAQWLPLQMQAGLLGRPAILGEGEEDASSYGVTFGG